MRDEKYLYSEQTHSNLIIPHAHDFRHPEMNDIVFLVARNGRIDRLYISKIILSMSDYFAASNIEIEMNVDSIEFDSNYDSFIIINMTRKRRFKNVDISQTDEREWEVIYIYNHDFIIIHNLLYFLYTESVNSH